MSTDVEGLAARIDRARRDGRTLDAAEVTLDGLAEAYAVQRALTTMRADRGPIVGWKLGYTSAVMRAQMGIDEPNYGPLLRDMVLESGAGLGGGLLQPRVEPEVLLVLGHDLDGPATPEDCAAACAAAFAALEVVDSVWTDYAFSLEHNTADGSSAAYVVRGEEIPMGLLGEVDVTLFRNASAVGRGRGSDAGGHPMMTLSWLSGRLAGDERGLRRGDLVLTGGLTAAVPIEVNDWVRADFSHRRMSTRGVSIGDAPAA